MSDSNARPEHEEQQPDPDRRKDLVKQALDTGFEDPLWLHNLAACSRFNDEAYADMLDTAEQLRHDAELIEEAHKRIESGELIPAEAAFYIATNVDFPFFARDEYGDTRTDLFDSVPITEEP